MAKVIIKILQGSAVTQIVFGGLTIYSVIANFLYVGIHQKLLKSAGSSLSYCRNKQQYFFGLPCTCIASGSAYFLPVFVKRHLPFLSPSSFPLFPEICSCDV